MYIDPIAWESDLPQLRPSSPAWRAVIRAIYGSPMSPEERELFASLAGREPPPRGATDAVVVAGRRSGKSETMARCALFEALQVPHADALAPGQLGIIGIMGAERAQALEIIRYASGILNSSAKLKRKIRPGGDLVESITLTTGIVIKILSADSTSVRSGTLVGAIVDEAAFLPYAGSDPDIAIIEALRPGLTPLKGAPPRRLVAITSANVRKGWIYDTVQTCRGNPDSTTLAVVGKTTDFNPNVDLEYLAERKRKNPTSYAREYESVFSDVISEGWFGADNLARAIDKDRKSTIMPYELGLRYHIAADIALHSDSTAIVVATSRWVFTDESRSQKKRVTHVVYTDRITPKPGEPTSIHTVIDRVRRACELYGTNRVAIDQFSSGVIVELMSAQGLRARTIPWTAHGEESKYHRYQSLREAMHDGSLRLPDDPQLLSELGNTRGTSLPSGATRLEASIGQDDMADACVMACSLALAAPPGWPDRYLTWYEKEQRQVGIDRLILRIHGV